jgi:hypothetical protein
LINSNYQENMLVTFKSKATADIIMYESHAKPFLDLLNKDVKRGVITAAECTAAITLLEQKMAEHKAADAAIDHEPDHHEDDEDDKASKARAAHVTFSARFFPLLDMLRAAKKSNTDILWGV